MSYAALQRGMTRPVDRGSPVLGRRLPASHAPRCAVVTPAIGADAEKHPDQGLRYIPGPIGPNPGGIGPIPGIIQGSIIIGSSYISSGIIPY